MAITSAAATDAQRAGIAAAIALWHGHGVAAFDPAPDGAPAAPAGPAASVDIQFADAAEAFHGVYDPAGDRVLINRGITDPATLSIVIAHELGHAFGLVHIPPATRISLMNPDNLVTPPTDGDQQALAGLWGSCR